ncbi:MAG TPA: DUF2783 domain-containing protein [Alicycliphilus sp.]|nr:DUF2783 domain-containing protein [Alicycliphilus sp.]
MTATTTSTAAALTIGGLETVYDALAQAIDHCGSDKTPLFLVKLALLNAQQIGDAAAFEAHIARALEDLL